MDGNQLLTLIQMILTVAALIVFGMIYPLIVLFEIIRHKIEQRKKLNWVLAIALTGPLAAAAWSFVHSRIKWKKWSGVAGLVAIFMSGVFYYDLARDVVAEMEASLANLEKGLNYAPDVNQNTKDDITQAIHVLHNDFDGLPISKFVNLSLNFRLGVTLSLLNSDTLKQGEADFWLKLYKQKQNLNLYYFDPEQAANTGQQ